LIIRAEGEKAMTIPKALDILIAVLSMVVAVYLIVAREPLWIAITAYWCVVSVRNFWKVAGK